jgi:hypothetical protein
MINGIKLKDLRNAEYLQFMKDTLSLTEANNPSALEIQPHYDALLEQVADLETLFRLSQASEFTEEIQALDQRRDRAISGIRQTVEGHCSHFLPETANAARLLSNNISLYGIEIERQNYQAQTAGLNGIVSDWTNKPELTEAMGLLKLNDWKDELAVANKLFNEKYLQRTQQYGAATDETISSEKAETNQLYYTLRDNIMARATINNTPAHEKTVSEINALIDQYNRLIDARAPKAKGNSSTAGPE